MKKLAITGSDGTIGTVLKKNLSDYVITPIDLPDIDVRNYDRLLEVLPNHDAVVHLAWDAKNENFRNCKINPDNSLMFYNIYRSAIETKVPRVIMASSIHADNFYLWRDKKLLTPDVIIGPDSPYGASKVFMESLGKYYSQNGLEVICLRFGGVNPEDKVDIGEDGYNKVWLSHKDCVELVRTCIEAKKISNNFLIIYGVSNNTERVHDYSNPLNWIPRDNADNKIKQYKNKRKNKF